LTLKTFIIAEAGVNHNGDLDRALAMVDAAKAFGADAVKFQTFTTENVMTRSAEKAEYQKRQTGEGSQFDMVKKLELDEAAHRAIVRRCDEIGIEFMSTAFDTGSHELLLGLGIKRIKIPSGEITNWPFIRDLLRADLPIILSTGMATMDEIDDTVAFIGRVRAENGFATPLQQCLTILHCTSNYPADFSDVNLRAMCSIAEHCSMPVGYSDHTLGTAVSTAAVALGATIIEKHFTLDKNLPGPDHAASIEPDEFAAMVAQIRAVELAMGSPVKAPADAELGVRAVARRSITSARDLAAGTELASSDLVMMRPGTGISPRELETLIGRRLKVSVTQHTALSWDMID
jgi:N,N'-diacetyllegionaminate synthase